VTFSTPLLTPSRNERCPKNGEILLVFYFGDGLSQKTFSFILIPLSADSAVPRHVFWML
jgi:hypothetical protein